MEKAFVRVKKLPDAPEPTKAPHINLTKRSKRKLRGRLTQEATETTDFGGQGNNWDKELLGSAQEDNRF